MSDKNDDRNREKQRFCGGKAPESKNPMLAAERKESRKSSRD